MCFEGLARLSRRVWRRFVRGSREISLVPSLHRASTDALIRPNALQAVEIFIDGRCIATEENGLTDRKTKYRNPHCARAPCVCVRHTDTETK